MFEQTFAPSLRAPTARWQTLTVALLIQTLLASALLAHALLASEELFPPVTLALFSVPAPPPPPPPGPRDHREGAKRAGAPGGPPQPAPAAAGPPSALPLSSTDLPPSPQNASGPGVEGGDSEETAPPPVQSPPPQTILRAWEVLPIRPLFQPAPAYPSPAVAMGLTGQVVLEIVVDEAGQVREARVVSSTNRLFDEAALEAVRRWRYSRPVDARSGAAVSCLITVTVHFRLR